MHTFAERPKATHQNTSAKSIISGLAQFGQSRELNPILDLRLAIGNQAEQRLLQFQTEEIEARQTGTVRRGFAHDFSRTPVYAGKPSLIQTKLIVNQPGDEYEQEADRVAERVIRMPEPHMQRQVEEEEEEEEEELIQTKPLAEKSTQLVHIQEEIAAVQAEQTGGRTLQVASGLAAQIDALLQSGGQPLPRETRAFFEPRFRRDFGQVRVHTGARAHQSAADMIAKAYTVGHHIVFAEGAYAPTTTEGRHLIAHELTHTIQQSAMVQPALQRAEVDEGATGVNCSTLADGRAALNAEVNNRLAAAYGTISARFQAANPSFVGPAAVTGPEMVEEAFNQLGAPALPHLAMIEYWANQHLPQRGGGTGMFVVGGTRYANIPLGMRPIYSYLAPVVKLNGICVGTDKIGHMFQQGWQYLMISQAGLSSGSIRGLGLGDRYARAWGEWMEGNLSTATSSDPAIMSWLRTMSAGSPGPAGIGGQTRGHFGLASTGVHSRGDLAANEAGMRFYRDLLSNPYMTFDINRYVNANWNEQVSGNIYSHEIGTAVTSSGRRGPRDVVLPP